MAVRTSGSSGPVPLQEEDRRPQRILAALAPKLMSQRIVSSPSFHPSHYHPLAVANGFDAQATLRGIARTRVLLPQAWGGREAATATEFLISDPERIADLLRLDVPGAALSTSAKRRSIQDASAALAASDVPLLAGFRATVPSASEAKQRRRQKRAGLGQKALGLDDATLGEQLKLRSAKERGLLTVEEEAEPEREGGVGRRKSTPGGLEARKARKARRQTALGLVSKAPSGEPNGLVPLDLSIPELRAELDEISIDRTHLSTRRQVLTADREAIDAEIAKFQALRADIDRQLLSLKEEELELVDEEEGVLGRIENLEATAVRSGTSDGTSGGDSTTRIPSTSRRRKGPAFLPSSHDALPRSTAFLTATGHSEPITALDFSCPYGTLVTSSLDSTVRLWDLTNGEEMGRLKGHRGVVNCLQVEGSIAVTGGGDHQLMVWNLEKAEDVEWEHGCKPDEEGADNERQSSIRDTAPGLEEGEGPCLRRLSGHAGSVTALYLDGNRLVSGAEDRTLREWNMETGQVVATLDVLWAMQNPTASVNTSPPTSPVRSMDSLPASPYSTPSASPIRPRPRTRASLGPMRKLSSGPSASTLEYLPPLDPSWEEGKDDFIGGLQHYGAALATGDRSAMIRLWDLRTGQAVRTLIGHTGAIKCLAFDETTLMSGGADNSLKIWDLRTGAILDTLRFDHAVTALQFDTRKIVIAAGENGVRIHNRTTLQQTSLVTNGHSAPVERLRYDDTYLVTGAKDCKAKAWAM